jgi:hypothetical protein
METVTLVAVVGGISLAILILFWIFRPAITSYQNAAKPKKQNTFSDHKGEIETDHQIQEDAEYDITLVVPAYNEVYILYIINGGVKYLF